MKTKSIIAALLATMVVLAICSCQSNSGPEFQTGIEPDRITIGYNGRTINVEKDTMQFQVIADEAMRVFQAIDMPHEEQIIPEHLDSMIPNYKYLEMEFFNPIDITISRFIEDEDRDRYRTNEDHYHIVEVLTAIFVFDKEYSSDVLSLRKNHEDWDVWGSKRSFEELEALVDELLEQG